MPATTPAPIEVAPAGSSSGPEMWPVAAIRPAPSSGGPALVTGMSVWAVSSKRTTLIASPSSMALMKTPAASRSLPTLVTPSPASSAMLPEWSSTRATALLGRATVLASMVITQVWPVSSQRTVTVPWLCAPAVVEV